MHTWEELLRWITVCALDFGKNPENRRDRWYSLLYLTENIGAFTDTRAY